MDFDYIGPNIPDYNFSDSRSQLQALSNLFSVYDWSTAGVGSGAGIVAGAKANWQVSPLGHVRIWSCA